MRFRFHAILGGAVLASAQGSEAPTMSLPLIGEIGFADESRMVEAASRRLQRYDLAPQAVTVLDQDDWILSPAATLADLLRYQAGIDVHQTRHGQYEVGLRGSTSTNAPRTLALYDGRSFRFEEMGALRWVGEIHQSDVDRVEIVRGPASVSYGANAFGGVIAISRRDIPDDLAARTFFQLGNYGLIEADATLAGHLAEDGFWSQVFTRFSLGTSRRDDWPGTEGAPYGPDHPRLARTGDTDLETLRLSAMVGMELPAGHVLELQYDWLDVPAWDIVQDYAAGVMAVDSTSDSIGLRLRAPWGEVRYTHGTSEALASNQKTDYGTEPDYWYTQGGFDDQIDELRAQVNHRLGDHVLTLGGEWWRLASASNFWAPGIAEPDPDEYVEITQSNVAGFAEDQWLISDAWALSAGLRVDHHSDVETNVSPRIAINYTTSAEEFWRASLLSGYRLPSVIEIHLDSRYFSADPDLEAETVQSVDLGWQRIFSEAHLEVGANAFYTRADDLIAFMPIPESEMSANWDTWVNARIAEFIATGSVDDSVSPSHFFEFTNTDNPQHTVGIELSARHQAGDEGQLTLWGNLTWTYSRFEDDVVLRSDGFVTSGPPAFGGGETLFRFDENLGKKVNTPPEWKLNLGATWRFSNGFCGFATRLVSEREIFSIAYSTWDDTDPDEVRTQTVPAYAALDLFAGTTWGDPRDPDGYLRFAVTNINGPHWETHRVEDEVLVTGMDNQYSSEVQTGLTVTAMIAW